MESYSDSDDDGLEIGMGMGVRQLLIISYFF